MTWGLNKNLIGEDEQKQITIPDYWSQFDESCLISKRSLKGNSRSWEISSHGMIKITFAIRLAFKTYIVNFREIWN